jgi:hypothetical protein
VLVVSALFPTHTTVTPVRYNDNVPHIIILERSICKL